MHLFYCDCFVSGMILTYYGKSCSGMILTYYGKSCQCHVWASFAHLLFEDNNIYKSLHFTVFLHSSILISVTRWDCYCLFYWGLIYWWINYSESILMTKSIPYSFGVVDECSVSAAPQGRGLLILILVQIRGTCFLQEELSLTLCPCQATLIAPWRKHCGRLFFTLHLLWQPRKADIWTREEGCD